jgi:hypothetical protein
MCWNGKKLSKRRCHDFKRPSWRQYTARKSQNELSRRPSPRLAAKTTRAGAKRKIFNCKIYFAMYSMISAKRYRSGTSAYIDKVFSICNLCLSHKSLSDLYVTFGVEGKQANITVTVYSKCFHKNNVASYANLQPIRELK